MTSGGTTGNGLDISQVISRLKVVSQRGNTYLCLCPAHEDTKPSLAVTEDGGKVLIHCFAGCKFVDIVRAMGLTPERVQNKMGWRRKDREYVYRDENNEPVVKVIRYVPKSFNVMTYDVLEGQWVWGKRVGPMLYRIPQIIENTKRVVVITEGEKNASYVGISDTHIGTCVLGGSSAKITHDVVKILEGRTCIVVPDCDQPGRKYAAAVAREVSKIATVNIVELDWEREDGYDVADWIKDGHAVEELMAVVGNKSKERYACYALR